jgi:aminoglycoside phosphotransferase (APT) family kinase protein
MGAQVRDAVVLQERHHILRVTLDDGRTLIVKRLRADGQKRPDGDAGFEREWVALSHLSGCSVVPTFLGGDRQRAVLMISELPAGRSLADSLLGDDPSQARADLVAYATSLARLNSVPPFPSERPARLAGLRRGRTVFDADEALDAAVAAIEAGPHGVVHGDPCPDNVVIGADGVCMIFDFEFATGGPVSLDAAYLLAPFPSCWCFAPLPAPVVDDALAAYRSVLPIDDRALDAATVVTAVSALGLLERVRDADHSWGLTTMRPRLLAWLDACARQRSFRQAGDRAASMGEALRAAWGDVKAPPYPAFATIS